jgi:hypothetical protein
MPINATIKMQTHLFIRDPSSVTCVPVAIRSGFALEIVFSAVDNPTLHNSGLDPAFQEELRTVLAEFALFMSVMFLRPA